MDASTPAVLFKAVPGLMLHGALGAARSLGRMGVRVSAFQDSCWAPIALSRYVAETISWKFAERAPEESLQRLLDVGKDLGGRPVLIPMDDVACLFVGTNEESLRARFRFPVQPRGLAQSLARKQQLHDLCQTFGVPTPNAVFPRSRADVHEFLAAASFPIVVKSSDPELLHKRKAARSVSIVSSTRELWAAYDAMEDPDEPNLMFQEYIPGGAESIWMFNGYFDAQSDCLFGFSGQKLRQFPRATGATSLGICRVNDDVIAPTKRFLKAIGYQGIVDLGYRYDARDGRYKMLDVNPRIGASFRLFAGMDGMDVVRALYLDLTGQKLPLSECWRDTTWTVENDDLQTYFQGYRQSALSLSAWLRSLRNVRERAWFAHDDPLPFIAMCGTFAAKLCWQRLVGEA